MLRLYPAILRAARNKKRNVLVYGEPGVGKEVVSSLISWASRAAPAAPFCLSIALDDEHNDRAIRGIVSHTGVEDGDGLIAKAKDGTCVLDQMESSGKYLQGTLLRVLEDKTRSFTKIGGHEPIQAQCRFITTFNKPPPTLVKDGELRGDLFSRFAIRILVPPLQEHAEDIPLLVTYLARRAFDDNGRADLFSKYEDEVVELGDRLKSKVTEIQYNTRGLNLRVLNKVDNWVDDYEERQAENEEAGASSKKKRGPKGYNVEAAMNSISKWLKDRTLGLDQLILENYAPRRPHKSHAKKIEGARRAYARRAQSRIKLKQHRDIIVDGRSLKQLWDGVKKDPRWRPRGSPA